MAETLSTMHSIAIAAGNITLSGSVFGMQYDALLACVFGGLVSLTYLPPLSLAKRLGTVAGSALLAGFFAPLIAVAGLHYLPWLQSVGDATRIASGAALGIAAQVLVPAGLRRLRSLVDGK